jgi:hypothetical protein
MMPRAICEDCGSLVEAELTHNGICAVGHYVHCGWGHQLSPDDLISDDVAEIISKLEAKLAKTVEALKVISQFNSTTSSSMNVYAIWKMADRARATLAEIEGEKG